MTGNRNRTLVVLSVLAVMVFSLDLVGWLGWVSATEDLALAPERGAARLIDGRLLSFPPAAQRSRRLSVRAMRTLPTGVAVEILERTAVAQRRWIVVHPAWATNTARGFLLNGDLDKALQALEQGLLRDPTSAYLHRLRALVWMTRGEVSTALEDLAMARALAPGLNEPEVELTPEGARAVRVRSLELRRVLYPRQLVETSIALAREVRRGGDEKRGREILLEQGNHPRALLERAQWALDEGDLSTSVKLLERIAAMRSAPRSFRARAWAMMALALDLQGDRQGASDAAVEALQLDPSSPDAFVALAALAERRGDDAGALEHLRRAWGMSPSDVGLLVRIAGVAERAGKVPDAVLALERAVELEPSSSALVARLVSLQLRSGDYTAAAMTLSKGLDQHPTDATLLALADRLRRDVGIR